MIVFYAGTLGWIVFDLIHITGSKKKPPTTMAVSVGFAAWIVVVVCNTKTHA